MVPMIIVLDTGVMDIQRPTVLDDVEAFVNDASNPSRHDEVLAALDGDWTALALRLGVTGEECACFQSEVWGNERDAFLDGIRSAVQAARATGDDLHFQIRPALQSHVEFDTSTFNDGITVVLARAVDSATA